MLLVAGMTGCGAEERDTDAEKAADVELLNAALGRELGGAALYVQLAPELRGERAALARRFRAHALEYANALRKAIRGAGGEEDVDPVEVDLGAARGERDLLLAAYGQESAALALYVEDAPRMSTDAPQTLAASQAAGHAQHLVLLRQALGASPLDSIPEAFDVGEVEPPGGGAPAAQG